MGDIEVHALRGINLEIRRGEFVAIMGASGSGKSTFMNILGALDRPTSGSYFLDGEDIGTRSSDGLAEIRKRRIGFVFQGFNLLSRMPAVENVELPMLYSGQGAVERRQRAMEVLTEVGLGGKIRSHTQSALRRPATTGCHRARSGEPPVAHFSG
jgi:putative ABC transport system ATP-binding protein